MDDGFWNIVGLASIIATAAATALTALTAMWWRRQDRAEADWIFTEAVANGRSAPDRYGNSERPPEVTAQLANAGDGIAFRVVAAGKGCDAALLGPLRPGGQVTAAYRNPITAVAVMRPGDDVYIRVTCEEADWPTAQLVVEWTRSPTWKKRRSRRRATVPLTDLVATAPAPAVDYPWDPYPT